MLDGLLFDGAPMSEGVETVGEQALGLELMSSVYATDGSASTLPSGKPS